LAIEPNPALLAGLRFFQLITGAAKTIIVADKYFNEAKWGGFLDRGEVNLILQDNARYPCSLSYNLIYNLTGREIPLPLGRSRDVGVAFVRLESAYWAGLAAILERPQTHKWVTVAQDKGSGRLLLVPLGTPVGHILKEVDLEVQEGGKVILGGRMTGYAIYDLDIPITKEIDGLIVQTPDQVRRYTQEPCFNCGICVRVCPTRLIPGELSKYCEYNRFEDAESKDLFGCIECGLCAYVCPAKRPMIHFFRHAKEEIAVRRAGQ
jgi:electron transport complex protein RnfC